MTDSIQFTAIPNGVFSVTTTGSTPVTTVSLSVYVTPQLSETTTLSAAAAAFANWPAALAALSFKVQFAGLSTPVPASLATGYAANLNSALWQSIFTPTMPISPWTVANYSTAGTLSYHAQAVSSTIKNAYNSVASLTTPPTISTSPPSTDLLSKPTSDINTALGSGPTIGNKVLAGAKSGTQTLSGTVANTIPLNAPEFARAAAFHNRGNYRNLQPSGLPGNSTTVTTDFHTTLGHLADHPTILRKLGIIIDLTFVLPAGLGSPAAVQVIPVGVVSGIAATQLFSPWTQCVPVAYTSATGPAATFRPYYQDVEGTTPTGQQPPVPLVDTNGLLCMDNGVILNMDDLDVDHAVVHVSHYAQRATGDLAAAAAAGGGSATVPVTLPALKTTGLTVHYNDRETGLGKRFTAVAGWNPNGQTFVGEDLVRGHRVDVRTVNTTTTPPTVGNWMSLCHRSVAFAFQAPSTLGTISTQDEGYVKAASTSASTTDPVYNAHEALFHWDGWSLVASRPGGSVGAGALPAGTVVTDPSQLPQDGPQFPVSTGAALGLPFNLSIAAQPGTLPKLRFGTSYQLRARAVNLVGGDMMNAASGPAVDHSTPVKVFRRYEPVSAPALHPRKPVTEGESVERLVIRSDPYGPTPLHATAWAAANTSAMTNAFPVTSNPPPATPPTPVPLSYFGTSERHVAPPKTSVHMAEYHGAFDPILASAGPQGAWQVACKENGSFYDTLITDSTTGLYQSYQQPGLSIITPAASVAPLNLARVSGQPVFTNTDAITPRGTSLIQGQYPVFDTTTVKIPYLPDSNAMGLTVQGLGSTTLYRSYGGTWPELGVFRIVAGDVNDGVALSGFDGSTPQPGAVPATTPITIPLAPATVTTLTYSSAINNPALHNFCPPSYTSAQQGLLPLLSPPRTLTLVHAVQRPAPPTQITGDIQVLPRNPGDTAIAINATLRFDGNSSGQVDLICQWNDYIDLATPAGQAPVDPSVTPQSHTGTVITITPNVADTAYPAVGKTPAPAKQAFGDTKRRDINYTTRATTRFREYFPSTITSVTSNIINTANHATIICPSTARPPPPKVLYAVPGFSFAPSTGASATTSGTTGTSVRSGVIRVYVDRGWYASGSDERLAVIFATSQAQQSAIPHLVSQWGNDPIWNRGAGTGSIAPGSLNWLDYTHVPTTTPTFFNQPLAEGLGNVHVATYTPNFNLARQLWYFDIQLASDQAYFPFLRLALARYQPEAVNSLNLSTVVCTEFVQLSAARSASVASLGSNEYSVSLSGVTSPNLDVQTTNLTTVSSGHRVTAEFQQALTASPDDLDWTTVANTTTTLSATSFSGMSVTFTGQMTFPARSLVSTGHRRILFREYELFASDSDVAQQTGPVQVGYPATTYTARIVYMDTVQIA